MKFKRPESRQPLPKKSKKVFEGVVFDVYQWKQEMYDGSFEVFEKLVRPDTVQVIPVTTDKRIIVVEVMQPGKKTVIRVPSGRVDAGEDIENAARRELIEETGYNAAKLVLWESFQPMSKVEWAIYTFIGKGCYKIGKPKKDKGEKIKKLLKISFDKFVDLVIDEKILGSELSFKFLKAKLFDKDMGKLKNVFLSTF